MPPADLYDDLPIVDAHHHLWDLEGDLTYPWLTSNEHAYMGDNSALRRSYMPPEYRRDTALHNVIATVHIEAECDRRRAVEGSEGPLGRRPGDDAHGHQVLRPVGRGVNEHDLSPGAADEPGGRSGRRDGDAGVDGQRRAQGYFHTTGIRPHHLERLTAAGLALPPEVFERRMLSPQTA